MRPASVEVKPGYNEPCHRKSISARESLDAILDLGRGVIALINRELPAVLIDAPVANALDDEEGYIRCDAVAGEVDAAAFHLTAHDFYALVQGGLIQQDLLIGIAEDCASCEQGAFEPFERPDRLPLDLVSGGTIRIIFADRLAYGKYIASDGDHIVSVKFQLTIRQLIEGIVTDKPVGNENIPQTLSPGFLPEGNAHGKDKPGTVVIPEMTESFHQGIEGALRGEGGGVARQNVEDGDAVHLCELELC